MKLNEKGITIVNLIILIATIGIMMIGCYFGFSTMIINNKKDNFVNTAKEYVEGAKEQLLSENFMPNSGEGVVIPYSQINLGKKYLSPYNRSEFDEDFSYVVIIKTFDQQAEYKYYVTQRDSEGNCIELINYDIINVYGTRKRQYVVNDNTCDIQSVSLFEPGFNVKNIKLDFDVKYYKYQKH